jgi:phosphatidylethanolamine-binding protein (PEBP) family uncharacterized protein
MLGRLAATTVGATFVLALLLAGCGGSSDPPQATGHRPNDLIGVSSPVYREARPIPARYTCDGPDVRPPIDWSAIPAGTEELALFIGVTGESEPGGGRLITWAVSGLAPTLRGLPSGKLPAGAVVGRNGLGQMGYTICPSRKHVKHYYLISLYGLTSPIIERSGFDAHALRAQAESQAAYIGLGEFSYERR